jgi:hypothetical protein
MRTTLRGVWTALACAAVIVTGCGGPSLGWSTTFCSLDGGKACLTKSVELEDRVPCLEGEEVASCPTEGVLAICTSGNAVAHMKTRVYSADVLADYQERCSLELNGEWRVGP